MDLGTRPRLDPSSGEASWILGVGQMFRTGVISDFPPCSGDIPLAGSLYHSLGCPSDSGQLRMCQKSLFLGKQTFQPGEYGSSPPHTISLVKEIFFGTYSWLCLLVVAFCLQNKQARNMPHYSHTVGFIFLWHFGRWCRKWASLQGDSRRGQGGLCGWQKTSKPCDLPISQ